MLKIFLFKGTSPVRHSVYEYKGGYSGTFTVVGDSDDSRLGKVGDIRASAFSHCEELI